jgi:hypothetical protein
MEDGGEINSIFDYFYQFELGEICTYQSNFITVLMKYITIRKMVYSIIGRNVLFLLSEGINY